MKYQHQFFFILLTAILASTSHAQKLSPTDREDLLAEVKKIEEKVNEKRIGNRKRAVEVFSQASSSDKAAFDFYLDCNKILNFEDKSFSDYRAWREKAEKRLKNKGSMLALQIQLKYLVISLRYAEGVELEKLIPEIEALVDQVAKNFEDLEDSGMKTVRESVNQSVFAKAYSLDESLKLDDWCYQPGDYNAMYDTILLPYYRQNLRDQLAAAWDKRIKIETVHTQKKFEDDETKLTEFKTEKLPKLHWRKNVDLYKQGFEENSALALKQIILADTDSPLANDRVEELIALLDGEWE